MAVRKKTAKKKTVSTRAMKKTIIDGQPYVLKTVAEVEEQIRDAARATGYGKFDVKDMNTNRTVAQSEIVVGGNYKIVPRATMG